MVSINELIAAIARLQLSTKPVCLHSSLRSFGWVEGGAAAIVDAFISEGCTLLVPTFSWVYAVSPPAHLQFRRNGADYAYLSSVEKTGDYIFNPATSTEIDQEMGSIPAALLARRESRRGNHPLCSFTALGPLADLLLEDQQGEDVYAPLAALADQGGFVLLAGVDLSKMTLIHLAEKQSGRTLLRRWANDSEGQPSAVEAGGCSDGFLNLAALLSPLARLATVGKSHWQAYPAAEVLKTTTQALTNDPSLTHCSNSACGRCNDLVAGGPILTSA